MCKNLESVGQRSKRLGCVTILSIAIIGGLLVIAYGLFLVICINTADDSSDIDPAGPCILVGTILAALGAIIGLATWVLIMLVSCFVLLPAYPCYKESTPDSEPV